MFLSPILYHVCIYLLSTTLLSIYSILCLFIICLFYLLFIVLSVYSIIYLFIISLSIMYQLSIHYLSIIICRSSSLQIMHENVSHDDDTAANDATSSGPEIYGNLWNFMLTVSF